MQVQWIDQMYYFSECVTEKADCFSMLSATFFLSFWVVDIASAFGAREIYLFYLLGNTYANREIARYFF